MPLKKILIVGAGPAGSTIARVMAEENYQIEIHDARDHIAGNCFDFFDEHGVMVHRYGPHYFRTNSEELLAWLSRFTEWIPGNYRVQAKVDDKYYPIPINLKTMEILKEKSFTEADFQNYLKEQRSIFTTPANAEEQCLSQVGKELYELFFKGYTQKQWGTEPKNLDPSITARIPLRFNRDDRYPVEQHQVYPKEGYHEMFKNILDHKNIKVHLNSKLEMDELLEKKRSCRAVVYTGPIDEYFRLKHGKLSYRSLRFEWVNYQTDYKQPCVQINYPNEQDYTRSVEIKHVTEQKSASTTVCYEYPASSGDKFYPLLTEDSQRIYDAYYALARAEEALPVPTYFIGRMAEFRYYNMDHVFLKALNQAKKMCLELKGNSA